MINTLGWETLEQRRKQAKAVMMFRITNNLVDIDIPSYIVPQGATTRGHNKRFVQPYCRTNIMRDSFFPSGILIWNSLPVSLATAPSLEAFKSGIAAAV